MRKAHRFTSIAGVLLSCALLLSAIRASFADEQFQVVHAPKDANVSYKYAGYDSERGLYRTTDAGRTWSLLNRELKFRDLLIHPITGKLYAIAAYPQTSIATSGELSVSYITTPVVSDDGYNWKDISGQKKGSLFPAYIMLDPEHPNRVLIAQVSMSIYIMQATDDEYSDWESGPSRLDLDIKFEPAYIDSKDAVKYIHVTNNVGF